MLAETFAQTLLKTSVTSNKNTTFMILAGTAAYIFVALAYRMVLKDAPLGIANVLWNAASVLSVFIVGYFVFDEKIVPMQMLGVVLVLLGGALL